MPADDGATRAVESPSCSECGAPLSGSIRVRVDDWCDFACVKCLDSAREHTPAACILHPLPRADGSDDAGDESNEVDA